MAPTTLLQPTQVQLRFWQLCIVGLRASRVASWLAKGTKIAPISTSLLQGVFREEIQKSQPDVNF
jgi:hypothetical protein